MSRRLAAARLQRDAELTLAALPPEVHHQLPGHHQRQFLAVVLRHQGQRQVHAGADARTRPHLAGAYEDRVGVHPHLGMVGRQLRGGRPVSGRPPPVQETGRRQYVCAHAHRRDTAGVRSRVPHPGHHVVVDPGHRAFGAHVDGAGHQQGVHRARHLRERQIRHETHPRRRDDGAPLGAYQPDLVPRVAPGLPVGQGEHLGRTGDVEEVDIGEDRDHDAVGAGGHASIVTARTHGRNDKHLSHPDTHLGQPRAGSPPDEPPDKHPSDRGARTCDVATG